MNKQSTVKQKKKNQKSNGDNNIGTRGLNWGAPEWGLTALSFLSFWGLLLLLTFKGESLRTNGILFPLYFILLVSVALLPAVILFKWVDSKASIKVKWKALLFKGSGAVAVFVLVLLFGIYILPSPHQSAQEPFDYTVFLRGPGDAVVSRNQGRLKMQLDNDLKRALVNEDGAADFKGIPAAFKNRTVRLELEAEDWVFETSGTVSSSIILKDKSHIVKIRRPDSYRRFFGIVMGDDLKPIVGALARLYKDSEPNAVAERETNREGVFDFSDILVDEGEAFRIGVTKDGYGVKNYNIYPGSKSEVVLSKVEN